MSLTNITLAPLDNVPLPKNAKAITERIAKVAIRTKPHAIVFTEAGYPPVRKGLSSILQPAGYVLKSGGDDQSVLVAIRHDVPYRGHVNRGGGGPMIPGVCRRRDSLEMQFLIEGEWVGCIAIHTAPLRRDRRGRVAALASHRRAARRIRRFVKNHPHIPTVIIGDFNTEKLMKAAKKVGVDITHLEYFPGTGIVMATSRQFNLSGSDHKGTRFVIRSRRR